MNDQTVEEERPRAMMTLTQVLSMVPVSRTTLFRMEREKRFPNGHFVSGNRKLYFADEVLAWQNALKIGRHGTTTRAK